MCETTKMIERTPPVQRDLLEIRYIATRLILFIQQTMERGDAHVARRNV